MPATAAQAQETIKWIYSLLTGSVAYNGKTDVNLRDQSTRASGGVMGKKIDLVAEDGQCRPLNRSTPPRS